MEEKQGYVPGIALGLAIGTAIFFAVIKILSIW